MSSCHRLGWPHTSCRVICVCRGNLWGGRERGNGSCCIHSKKASATASKSNPTVTEVATQGAVNLTAGVRTAPSNMFNSTLTRLRQDLQGFTTVTATATAAAAATAATASSQSPTELLPGTTIGSAPIPTVVVASAYLPTTVADLQALLLAERKHHSQVLLQKQQVSCFFLAVFCFFVFFGFSSVFLFLAL